MILMTVLNTFQYLLDAMAKIFKNNVHEIQMLINIIIHFNHPNFQLYYSNSKGLKDINDLDNMFNQIITISYIQYLYDYKHLFHI